MIPSQPVRSHQDFLVRELLLTRKLLNQGFLLVKWKSSFQKFHGRHHELVNHYGIISAGVIGAIDGCHIPIKAPRENDSEYINRKGFHSLQLQAVCDGNLMFVDVYCGWPGSVHDARLLRVSPLAINAEINDTEIFNGCYVIGDQAYPLKTWLMVPFRDGNLSSEKQRFNRKLCIKRQRIEHAFALLNGRFRKLKVQMDIDNNGDIPDIAKAACVMHNIALLTDDNIYDFLGAELDEEIKDFHNVFSEENDASDKRRQIIENL